MSPQFDLSNIVFLLLHFWHRYQIGRSTRVLTHTRCSGPIHLIVYLIGAEGFGHDGEAALRHCCRLLSRKITGAAYAATGQIDPILELILWIIRMRILYLLLRTATLIDVNVNWESIPLPQRFRRLQILINCILMNDLFAADDFVIDYFAATFG